MAIENISNRQHFALSLAAPIIASGSDGQHYELAFESKNEAKNLLSSWWGIESRQDLEETLDWLLEEGGHTIVFNRMLQRMSLLTYKERQFHIEALVDTDRDEWVRAGIVHKYIDSLGPYTVLAFDICRATMLIREGYAMEWFTEEETWHRLYAVADQVFEQRMFTNHFDYLFSYYVGRAFGMKQDVGQVKESLCEARRLLVGDSSPYLNGMPWPQAPEEVMS